MATAAAHVEAATRKLAENVAILEAQHLSFFGRLKKWFADAAAKEDGGQAFSVEYTDEAGGSHRTEQINFSSFSEKALSRMRVLGALSNKMSAPYQRIASASPDKIFELAEKNLAALRLTHKRLEGLSTCFRKLASKEQKGSLRGIRIELTAIKNVIMRANQSKHEYAAKQEEQEQMKKLGIDPGGE